MFQASLPPNKKIPTMARKEPVLAATALEMLR